MEGRSLDERVRRLEKDRLRNSEVLCKLSELAAKTAIRLADLETQVVEMSILLAASLTGGTRQLGVSPREFTLQACPYCGHNHPKWLALFPLGEKRLDAFQAVVRQLVCEKESLFRCLDTLVESLENTAHRAADARNMLPRNLYYNVVENTKIEPGEFLKGLRGRSCENDG